MVVRAAWVAIVLWLAACGGRAESNPDADGSDDPSSSPEPFAPGGVGAPCTPIDEDSVEFPGSVASQISVDDAHPGCESRVCVVNYFQGRVSCPRGQTSGEARQCAAPRTGLPIVVAVPPALSTRPASERVHCSCACDGPDPNADYCTCPAGMTCTQLFRDILPGSPSYCVRAPVAAAERAPAGECLYGSLDPAESCGLSCAVDGRTEPDGSGWSSSDGCLSCACHDGLVSCPVSQCPRP